MRIEADRFGKVQELNDIEPALAALSASHERLILMESLGHIRLRQVSPVPSLSDRAARIKSRPGSVVI
jgi:hypothetical protein